MASRKGRKSQKCFLYKIILGYTFDILPTIEGSIFSQNIPCQAVSDNGDGASARMLYEHNSQDGESCAILPDSSPLAMPRACSL